LAAELGRGVEGTIGRECREGAREWREVKVEEVSLILTSGNRASDGRTGP